MSSFASTESLGKTQSTARMKGVNLSRLARTGHTALAWFVALPSVLMFSTGVLLLLRQDWSWVQPRVQKGVSSGLPTLSIHEAFERVKAEPRSGLSVEAPWSVISSVDVKPSAGILAFRLKSGIEVQVDGTTGAVLSAAPRRTSLLIELHQGSFFHPWVMKGLFLPVGLSLLGLWLSGITLMVWKKKRGVARS
jgi:hypothetical protein